MRIALMRNVELPSREPCFVVLTGMANPMLSTSMAKA
jgi:hypothetical protein